MSKYKFLNEKYRKTRGFNPSPTLCLYFTIFDNMTIFGIPNFNILLKYTTFLYTKLQLTSSGFFFSFGKSDILEVNFSIVFDSILESNKIIWYFNYNRKISSEDIFIRTVCTHPPMSIKFIFIWELLLMGSFLFSRQLD